MQPLTAAFALLALCGAASAKGRRALPSGPRRQLLSEDKPSARNCTWRTIEQQLDHFGEAPGTFKQRYCLYDGFWRTPSASGFKVAEGRRGPIFFYTGNESPVEEYVNNTGLMWEAGERMGALLIFAEHRYETGLSAPELNGTVSCFAYCTTAQALADYALLLGALRDEFGPAPAVAFGGSYGGMLAGWLRMRYPEVVQGAIAASAPVWGLATTMTDESMGWSMQAVSRAASSAGGASDRCAANIRAAWPLMQQVGQSDKGLQLLSEAALACQPLRSVDDLLSWAGADEDGPWFDMAEGDYPFASTYITFAVGPGYYPLPPWPMRTACQRLDQDFGVKLEGRAEDVKYTLRLGELEVAVDWGHATGNAASLTEQQIRESGVLELVAAMRDALGVWYNVTQDKVCYDISGNGDNGGNGGDAFDGEFAGTLGKSQFEPTSSPSCPTCPPCDDCPPCPVSHCELPQKPCSYTRESSFSYGAAVANEDLNLYNNLALGAGRDMFWPPSYRRNASVEDVVGPHHLQTGPAKRYDARGLTGAPTVSDPWSGWMTAYYGGRDITEHTNIVWSNGGLDPWSGAGVYPPSGGPTGPMVQNFTEDGSQVSLVIDLGGHHLDLFFADPNDPPAATAVRQIEEAMMRQWCQEAYDLDSYSSEFPTVV